MTRYVIGGISLPPTAPSAEALLSASAKLRKASLCPKEIAVYRRSVDARRRDDIRFIYSVVFTLEKEPSPEKMQRLSIRSVGDDSLKMEKGSEPMSARPVIVGMGPCGLFAALLLSEEGYRPILIERGAEVFERVSDVRRFYLGGELDENSNIQFGAGGAGTFSDGKLVTRIGDDRNSYILRRFTELGAPKSILTNAKPHIGTDILRSVVSNAAAEIIKNGGEIHYKTTFLGYGERHSNTRRVFTSNGEFEASSIVLAIGHSARDTYKMLLDTGCGITAKDFSVGLRIEHRKQDIDRALLGKFAGSAEIPYAEYSLSANTKVRGVYTFCMCPGGEVVCGASERGGLTVNGMSRYKRDGENSNSAVCVSVFKGDYGATPEGAIEFQRSLERSAFLAGGKTYAAPVCTVKNFLNSEKPNNIESSIAPTYMNGRVMPADLRSLFPKVLGDTLAMGLSDFGRKIRGFDAPDALLTGIETRTSSPVRILRTESMAMNGTDGIFPGGEGAGYAGGITSAAIDGVKIALRIIERYKPFD